MKEFSLARRCSYQFLYSLLERDSQFNLEDALTNYEAYFQEFLKSYLEIDEENPNNEFNANVEFTCLQWIKTVLKHYTESANDLAIRTKFKQFDKIPSIEKAALLLGFVELKYYSSTPTNVILNEYIELTKKFGTKDTSKFVNAILDKVAKDVRTA